MTDRVKTKRRRVKTGCLTCRRRRVRCDEEKPICAACQHMQLECHYQMIQDTPGIVSLRKDQSSWSPSVDAIAVDQNSDAMDEFSSGRGTSPSESGFSFSADPNDSRSSSHSPILKNISTLSLLPLSNVQCDLGSQMRLYHHFTSIIVPELEQRSPFLEVTSGIWRSEIAIMSFGRESLLHSLLALAAKDLALKVANPGEASKALEQQTLHEGQALQSIASELTSQAIQIPTVMSVLMLIWLSLINDRLETAAQHFKGLQVMMENMPTATFTSGSGREMARMFIALDVTRAALRTASNRPLTTTTTWISRQLQLSASADIDSQLMYELLDISSRIPMVPDVTFLEFASRSKSTPLDFLELMSGLLEELRSWRVRSKSSPSFQMVDCQRPGDGSLGFIIYATPEAALLMAYYYMGLIRVAGEWRMTNEETPGERKASKIIHQIANGAMQMYPSAYSRQLLDVQAALNIFRPLFACDDTSHFPNHRQWEDRLFSMAGRETHETVLNLNSPWFFATRRIIDDICVKYLGKAGLRVSSKMGPPGLVEDFSMRDFYIPHEVDGDPKPTAFYCVYSSSAVAFRVMVLEQQMTLDSLELEPDWVASAHWSRLVELHQPKVPLAEPALSGEIISRIEAVLDDELEQLEQAYG